MGKIVAMADGDQVEIIMSDGEDAAICKMTPDEALHFVMQIISAAQKAAS